MIQDPDYLFSLCMLRILQLTLAVEAWSLPIAGITSKGTFYVFFASFVSFFNSQEEKERITKDADSLGGYLMLS